MILLGDSADTFNGTLEQMQNYTGATDTAFEKLNTNSYTIQKAFNQLKNTAIKFGTAIMSVLAPILMALAEKIQAFTAWFSGFSDGTKKMIVIIAMVVAAVGPVLIIIGKIATGISAVMVPDWGQIHSQLEISILRNACPDYKLKGAARAVLLDIHKISIIIQKKGKTQKNGFALW